MPNDWPENDLRKIWQSQPTETSGMTLERLRRKMRELHAKTRRQLLGTLAGPAVAVLFYTFSLKQLPPLKPGVQLLFWFAVAWSLAGLYFLNRGMWSVLMPGDAGLSTGLEFCRREIERRRQLLRRLLIWSFGPIVLAIGTFILALAIVAGRGGFQKAVPFLTLAVVWIAAYFFIVRVREQRELQRQIQELNDIEREKGAS